MRCGGGLSKCLVLGMQKGWISKGSNFFVVKMVEGNETQIVTKTRFTSVIVLTLN